MRGRRWLLAAVLLGAVLGLSACSTTETVDPGAAAALPEPSYVNVAQGKDFDTQFAKLDKSLTAGNPVRGTVFKHAAYGGKSSDAEFDVVIVGKDRASIFVRSRVPDKTVSSNLDTLHLAGNKYDYHLLGPAYRSIAKTPWVRTPTVYGDPLNVCLLTGYQTICDMEDAVTITKKEGTQAVKRVVHNADGTITLITGVTLRSLLKYNFLLNVPKAISSQFTTDMLDYQLSARFTINRDGSLKFAEIIGVVPGKTDFVAQVGYQVTGVPSQADLPQLPAPAQVTSLSSNDFYKQLDAINGA